MIYYKTFIILKGILRTEDIEVWNWCQTQRNDDYWYFRCHRNKVDDNELVIETNHHFSRADMPSRILYIYNKYHDKCDSIKVEVWDDFEGTPDEPMKLTGTIETEYEWFEFFRDYEKRKNKEKHQI